MTEIKITKLDRKNYVLGDNEDILILSLIKKLEKKRLNIKDKEIVRLIKTQLKKDWRSPLIYHLKKISKKY